jgi:hypothetical protein
MLTYDQIAQQFSELIPEAHDENDALRGRCPLHDTGGDNRTLRLYEVPDGSRPARLECGRDNSGGHFRALLEHLDLDEGDFTGTGARTPGQRLFWSRCGVNDALWSELGITEDTRRATVPLTDPLRNIVTSSGRALSDDLNPRWKTRVDSPTYGYLLHPIRSSALVVVEGASDGLALYAVGLDVLVLLGAPNAKRHEVRQDLLTMSEHYPLIWSAFDHDKAGDDATEALRDIVTPLPFPLEDKDICDWRARVGRRQFTNSIDVLLAAPDREHTIAVQKRLAYLRADRQARQLLEDELRGELQPMSARTLTEDDLDQIEDLTWLIGGVIPATGVTMLVGPSNAGKSFVALDWALRFTTPNIHGWESELTTPIQTDTLTRDVGLGSALYIPTEGELGYKPRIRAWRAAHPEAQRGDFRLLKGGFDLGNEWQVEELVELVAENHIGLVVIDTLNGSAIGVEENSNTEMGRLMSNLQRVTRAGAAVLLVHHTGKATGASARGAGAILAAADAEIQISRKPADAGNTTFSMRVTKMRDGHRPELGVFHLAVPAGAHAPVVRLGFDTVLPTIARDATIDVARLRAYLLTVPPQSKDASERQLTKLATDAITQKRFREAWKVLEDGDEVMEQKEGRKHLWHVVSVASSVDIPAKEARQVDVF